jgi:hypothetical protein
VIAAVDVANPSYSFGFLGQSATSIVEGGNTVYFSQGDTIYSTSVDLQGLNVFKTNEASVSGLEPRAGALRNRSDD